MHKTKNVTVQLYQFLIFVLGIYGFIMLAIYIFAIIFGEPGMATPILNIFFSSAHVFALVMGIIVALFYLPHFIRYGITRKTFIVANSLASLSMFLTLYIVVGMLNGVFDMLGYQSGDLALDIPGNSVIVAIGIYSLTNMIPYTAGWMIALLFKQGGKLVGIVGIVLAIAIFNLYAGTFSEVNVHLGVVSFTLFGPVAFPQYLLIIIGLVALPYALIIPINKQLDIKAK